MSKVCPFRKKICFLDTIKGEIWNVYINNSTYAEEDFMECYESKCAVYNEVTQTCGMVNQARRL